MSSRAPEQTRILLVDDDPRSLQALTLLLSSAGYATSGCASGNAALELFAREGFDVVITDLFLPDLDGIGLLQQLRAAAPQTEVIVVTGHASAQTAVRAMKEGAFDYITKPLNLEELKVVLEKVQEKRRLVNENVSLKRQLREKFRFDNIIGSSPAMQQVFSRMEKIIPTDSTVLVLGESGTGKELVAKAIHFNGPRRNKPFVAVHCGAIPENLLESELFGHTRGAFTGAIRDKAGKFEAAHQGTIFLDEIGTLPMHLQIKLLRVLQEQEVERIGSNKPVKLDVRIISATNSDLEEAVRQGTFREDLYYRLNVIPIRLPSLRERTADILPLFRHFLEQRCRELQHPLLRLEREAAIALEGYDWPGNVRELENLVERTVALADHESIGLADLPPAIGKVVPRAPQGVQLTSAGLDLPQTVSDLERQLIAEALQLAGGVKARAAELLKLNRTTLVEKMRRLGMREEG